MHGIAATRCRQSADASAGTFYFLAGTRCMQLSVTATDTPTDTATGTDTSTPDDIATGTATDTPAGAAAGMHTGKATGAATDRPTGASTGTPIVKPCSAHLLVQLLALFLA